jgi:hypothetical protein
MHQRESECMVKSQIDQKVRISNDFYSVCPTVESTSNMFKIIGAAKAKGSLIGPPRGP